MPSSSPDPHDRAPAPGKTSLTTRTGMLLQVRPAVSADEPQLSAFFEHVTPDDLRFRFLSAIRHVGQDQIAAMLSIDHDRIETLLAFAGETGQLVGVSTLAADATGTTAEVAISIHRDWKGRGIGWSLLRHVAQVARTGGIQRLQSIESRDNYAAIELEREMGFTAKAYPGDATLMLVEVDLMGDPGLER